MFPRLHLKNLRNSFCLLFLFSLGCQTTEKATIDWSNLQAGRWEASAEVKQNRTGKSHSLDLMFRAVKDKGVRLDVSAMLGTPVASIVVETNQITGLLIRQKKYYVGSAKSEVLKQALGIGFEPKLISAILFNNVAELPGWNCKSEKESRRCVGPKEDVIVLLSNVNDVNREAEIDTADFNMSIKFKKFSEKFSEANIFQIKKPKSFNTVTL